MSAATQPNGATDVAADVAADIAADVVYVVRLREHFRLRDDPKHDAVVHQNGMQAAFLSQQAAQAFARNCPPVDKNPFDLDDGFTINAGIMFMSHWDDVEDDGFDDDEEQYDPSNPPSDSETMLSEFADLCRELSLVPPDLNRDAHRSHQDFNDYAKSRDWQNGLKNELRQWWEKEKNAMTTAQKETLWRKLHPRPYEIVPVPMER